MGAIGKIKNIIEWCEWFSASMKCDRAERLSLGKAQIEPIHVVMNGPTLKDSIHLINEIPGKVLMVNSAISHLEDFNSIKPNYYCLADPAYIDPNAALADLVVNTWESINQYNGPLELFVPNLWKNKFLINKSNIHVRYVISVPAPKGKHLYEKLQKNTGAPAFQGVVVMGLYVALQLGYKKIYLHGAEQKRDNIFVNERNELYIRDVHLYKEKKTIKNLTLRSGIHMLDEYHAEVNLFENLYLLRDYSAICGAKIINVSTDSLIDCFERYYKRDL